MLGQQLFGLRFCYRTWLLDLHLHRDERVKDIFNVLKMPNAPPDAEVKGIKFPRIYLATHDVSPMPNNTYPVCIYRPKRFLPLEKTSQLSTSGSVTNHIYMYIIFKKAEVIKHYGSRLSMIFDHRRISGTPDSSPLPFFPRGYMKSHPSSSECRNQDFIYGRPYRGSRQAEPRRAN